MTIASAGKNRLSNRNLRGQFYERFEMAQEPSWIDTLSFFAGSDSDAEEYADLDRPPTLKPKQSGDNLSSPSERSWIVENEEFTAGLRILKKHLRRDKTALIQRYMSQLAMRSQTHWRKLLSDTINAMKSTVISRDNKTFFAVDHFEGSQTSQNNKVTSSEISELSVVDAANPTATEFADILLALANHFTTFKDQDGEPFYEDPQAFHLMVPVKYGKVATTVFGKKLLNGGNGSEDNIIPDLNFSFTRNARLTWGNELVLFVTDTENKPMIRQSEQLEDSGEDGIELVLLGIDSEHAKLNDEIIAKINASRNTGMTHSWHTGIHATLSTAS